MGISQNQIWIMNLEEETKHITLEYIRTGCEGYQRLLKYINGDMKGYLNLNNTKVSYLPDGLKVGWLDLENTPINSLPEDLKVDSYLNLNKTYITNLPKGLKVGGALYLRNTPITSLPKDLEVGYTLHLWNTPISKKYTEQQLKQMLPNVKGRIYTT